MARTLNPVSHAVRRVAFVDAALGIIQTKGYEQMSIQDVLDELGASKGAFYHYFATKEALLAAVVERTVEAATETVEPIAADPDLSALQKLEGIFAGIAQWKGERTELILELMQVWFSDDNTIVRERLRRAVTSRLTPMLVSVLRQGAAEGTFSMGSPEGTASVFVALILGLNETASQLYLARQSDAISFDVVERTLASYTEAFERILGLPPGGWPLYDPALVRRWFGSPAATEAPVTPVSHQPRPLFQVPLGESRQKEAFE
jgi:AcrR family transcriptional regulator